MPPTANLLCIHIVLGYSLSQSKSTSNANFVNGNDDKEYLHPGITKSCLDQGTLVIQGFNVKTSDFVRTNGDIYNLCGDDVKLKVVKLFVLNSLLVDTNVDVVGTNLKMFVIAPTWTIIGSRTIAVDGAKGDYIPRAKDGSSDNMNGEDGKPGFPGGPGGNFFGIGENFTNGNNLVITANGGVGGTGQYGGNGFNQKMSRYVDVNSLGKIWCGLYYDICRSDERKYQLRLRDNYGNLSDFSCQGLHENNNMESCSFRIFGWTGEEGGRGGNGGRGGKGGLPGNVTLVDVKGFSQVSAYNELGNYGQDGKGGFGGKRGRNGHSIIYKDSFFFAPPNISVEVVRQLNIMGANGSDGYNSINYVENLKEAEVLEQFEINTLITEYKSYAREITGNVISHSSVLMFYNHLSMYTHSRGMCNFTDFVKELDDIDAQFNKLKPNINFVFFYTRSLKGVLLCAEKYCNDSSFDENRKMLSFLYSDVMGKIFTMSQKSETYLVIEIPKYLELVKKNLKDLYGLIDKNSRFDNFVEKIGTLNKYKENYRFQVDKLIRKFKKYLENKSFLNVDNLSKELTLRNRLLVREMITHRKLIINYEQEMLKWGKQLEDVLVKRSVLSSIKVLNELYMVLSDFAEIASSAVETGAAVPICLLLTKRNTTETKNISEPIETLRNRIKLIKSEEVSRLGDLLENVLVKTKENPRKISDVIEEIIIVKKKLNGKNNFFAVNALRSDSIKALKIKEEELSVFSKYRANNTLALQSQAQKTHDLGHSAFVLLHRITAVVKFGRGMVDVYNEYQHNNEDIDIIIESVKRIPNVLRTVKEHEDIIYNAVYIILQQIEDLSSESSEKIIFQLADQVKDWNIQLALEGVGKNIFQFADSFHTKFDLLNLLRNTGGLCTSLIDIYNHIKSYWQQKKIENHISDISFAIANGIKVTDEKLSKQFEKKKNSLSSILVLEHYQKAINTFKQFVFPLAHVYLKEIVLPDQLIDYEDVGKIISTGVTQIDHMIRKVEEYKVAVLNGNETMGRKDFNSHRTPPNPFFTWKNEHYNEIITQLLSGEEVTVDADIAKSDLTDHAIKFNTVHFYFKSPNKTIQEIVDDTLGMFEMSATHLGVSQYRYSDKFYLMTSDDLDIWHSCAVGDDGEPMAEGGAYGYIKNADIMLSPYSKWKLQLSSWDGSFSELLELKDDVDLELRGNGYYISQENVSRLDLHLDEYYNSIDKYEQMYLHDDK